MKVVGKANPSSAQATKKLRKFVRGRSPQEKAAYDTAVQFRRPADVSKALAMHVPAIEASEALGASPHLFADRDFSNPVMTLLPEYSDLKLGAKLLSLRCEIRAKKGDVTGTVQDLQAIEGLAKAAAAEPLLVSQLVSCSLSSIRLDALNVAANALAADPAALRALHTQVAATEIHADTERALHGETYLGTYVAKNLTKEIVEMTSTSPERLLPKFVPIGIVRRAYEARMLDLFAKAARAPKGEKWRILTDARRAAARSAEPTDQIIGDVLPIFEGTDVTVQSTATKVKILGALLAIAEQRAASGVWPTSWAKVPGGAPISPLGGKPLRFKVEGGKLTVYSIGLDGVDETERAPLFPEKSDDLEYEWTAQA
ncbi:MAG: hypothetical protein AB7F50_08350 [Fimbriimonadaceae bacterium]